jgi:hypothetical protein
MGPEAAGLGTTAATAHRGGSMYLPAGRSADAVPRVSGTSAARWTAVGLLRTGQFVAAELRRPAGRRVPGLWRHGLHSDRAELYDLGSHPPELYLNDLEAGRLGLVNGRRARAVLRDKLAFRRLVGAIGAGELLPRLLGTVVGGTFVRAPGTDRDLPPRLVVKPVCGRRGEAVRVVGPDLLSSISGGPHLVEEHVGNHRYAQAIFPGATNTLRITTLHRGRGEPPHVIATYHRFGTSRSAPCDNFDRQGVVAGVEPTTGVLSAGTLPTPRGARRQQVRHPETGATIAGTVVPAWHDALESVVRLATRLAVDLPGADLVGWDVIVTERGPVVLEANGSPGVVGGQTTRPLLVDPELRDLLVARRVLTRARARRIGRLLAERAP